MGSSRTQPLATKAFRPRKDVRLIEVDIAADFTNPGAQRRGVVLDTHAFGIERIRRTSSVGPQEWSMVPIINVTIIK